MAPYIFMERNGIHIIDLYKTAAKLEDAANVLRGFAKSGKKILFVATKKQAKEILAAKAESVGMPYVIERWPGGMLTNFPTIRKAVKKMASIDKMAKDGTFDNLSKREKLQITRQRAKLEKNLGSIADLNRLPSALFVVDVCKEHIAVAEANRLGIPVFAIVDTNSDPNNVDYVIPANDDASKSIELILDTVCEAINEGLQERKVEKADEKAGAENGEAVRLPQPRPRQRRLPPRRPRTPSDFQSNLTTTKKTLPDMAVTMAEITKLRNLTSAGLMDCKKALAETNGDIEAAVEILRKKGQAVAAKREDRQASEGCVIARTDGQFAAILALNCETDFVAKNAGFVALANKLMDLAMANKFKTVDELKAFTVDGQTVADLITEESGKTGEKTEIGAYEVVEAPTTAAYNHFNNKLAAIVGFNLEGVDPQIGREVCMQIASMNPVAVCREDVPQATIDAEISVAVEKTKQEQVRKAVEAALKKAGLNPNHFDSEDHIESNISKGWITPEEAAKGREIMKATAEAKAANLPEQMIQNIANGRLNKFFKESCLMEQEFVQDSKLTVGQFLEQSQKGLVVVNFKRVNLNQD